MAGNLAAATSFYTILSGCAQSLFAHGKPAYPSVEDISAFSKRIASEIYDDVRALGDGGFFGVLLFGFDFTDRVPFLIEIEPKLDSNGLYNITSKIHRPKESFLILKGSGKAALEKYISELSDQSEDFSEHFYRFVNSKIVKTVGGLPQVLVVNTHEALIEPVVIGSDDGSSSSIYHSGLNVDGYNLVGKYGVGRTMLGFNMGARHRYQALTDEGYDPNDPGLTIGQINQSMLQWLIRVHARQRSRVTHTGTATVAMPRNVGADRYIAYNCPSCNANTPIFRNHADILKHPFHDKLKFQIKCFACGNEFTSEANSFRKMYFRNLHGIQ